MIINNSIYDQLPDILNVAQVQALLCIGRNATYHLIRDKKIKSFTVGRNIRIPKRYLLDFIEDSCYTASTAKNRLSKEKGGL